MKARFRVRRGDEELQARTLDEFRALVRSGEIGESDLVHDALTGEWAPARAHPVYRLVVEEEAAGEAAGDQPSPGVDAEGPGEGREDASSTVAREDDSSTTAGEDGLVMELVEEEERSPEEETRAFIEQMERERRDDPDRHQLGEDVEVVDGRGATTVSTAGSLDFSGSPDPEKSSGAFGDFDVGADRERPTRSRPYDSGPSPDPSGSGSAPRSRPGKGKALALLGVAVLALGVTAAVAHPSFRFPRAFPGVGDEEAAREVRDAPPPTDGELRARAGVLFLEALDSLRGTFDLDRIPPEWLQGRYLANASDHPEVEEFWTDYLRYLERAHATEEALFRNAYLAVLDRAGMGGAVRSLRLARATRDFQAETAERRDLYARAWELAVAARDLHLLLVDLEDRISYEPARSERLSADPVTEAAGTDEEAQASLDQALDRVLEALRAVPGGGREVHSQDPDWLVRSLGAEVGAEG